MKLLICLREGLINLSNPSSILEFLSSNITILRNDGSVFTLALMRRHFTGSKPRVFEIFVNDGANNEDTCTNTKYTEQHTAQHAFGWISKSTRLRDLTTRIHGYLNI